MRIRTSAALAAGTVAGGIVSTIGRNWLRSRRSALAEAASMDRPRQVWMINHYAIAPDMPGGTRHYELSSLLPEHGWQTRVFATPFSHKEARYERPVTLGRLYLDATEAGVAFTWLYTTSYKRNDWRRYLNMLSFFFTTLLAGVMRERPDVVIGSSPHLFGALSAWIVAKRHAVPLVLEIRDLWPDTLIDMGLTNPLIIRPLAAIERFLYSRAAHIVALTEGIREGILAKGVDGEKVSFVPNAPMGASPVWAEQRDRRRCELGWDDKRVFVYAGAHGDANALDEVVEAARLCANDARVLFVLIGDGPSKPDLVERATGLRNIQFMDAVPKTEIMPILAAADVGLLTLRKSKVFEGARPNKLFDYLAADLPIVLTLPGEARALVEGASCGVFVPPGEPCQLADTVRRLAHDSGFTDELRGNLEGLRRRTLSREDTAAQLATILNGAVHVEKDA